MNAEQIKCVWNAVERYGGEAMADLVIAELGPPESLPLEPEGKEGADEGKIWSALRRKLQDIAPQLGEFVNAGRYEMCSAILDDIARKLTAEVAALSASPPGDCERCQGNGEIVTDHDRYLNPLPGDVRQIVSWRDRLCDWERRRKMLAGLLKRPAEGGK